MKVSRKGLSVNVQLLAKVLNFSDDKFVWINGKTSFDFTQRVTYVSRFALDKLFFIQE